MQRIRTGVRTSIALASGVVIAANPITIGVGSAALAVLATWAVMKQVERTRRRGGMPAGAAR